jgi:hypothetical protein
MAEPGEERDPEVLGNLPRHRPNIETPRRARARAAAGTASAGAAANPPAQAQRSEIEELERLAIAGVRLAGGAAVGGLKLAGRAVGGLGRAVGRR